MILHALYQVWEGLKMHIHTNIHTYFICNSPKGLFSYKRNKKDKNMSIKMNKQNGKGV